MQNNLICNHIFSVNRAYGGNVHLCPMTDGVFLWEVLLWCWRVWDNRVLKDEGSLSSRRTWWKWPI